MTYRMRMRIAVDNFVRACNKALDDATEVSGIAVPGAHEYGTRVAEKITAMRTWAKEHHAVTPRMEDAVEAMHGGLKKWLHDR